MVKVIGKCSCGQVTFEATPDQVRSVLCHCQDCRRAHSAPMYSCAYFPNSYFKILSGKEVIKSFQGTNLALKRHFCSMCGSRVFNKLKRNGIEEIGVFPSLFVGKIPDIYKPQYHVWTSEAVMDLDLFVNDGLPKNSHGITHPLNIKSNL